MSVYSYRLEIGDDVSDLLPDGPVFAIDENGDPYVDDDPPVVPDVATLKEGDGARVFDGLTWRYALVVAVVHDMSHTPSCIKLQVTTDGDTRTIYHKDWTTKVSALPECHRFFHPSARDLRDIAAPYCPLPTRDAEEWIVINAITALPAYEKKSFEELRLEDYASGVYHYTCDHVAWGGSNMNLFLEADLGTKRLILRRPPKGMYTKTQCLHMIKRATVKSSKERGRLIRFLCDNNLVPNQRAVYKLLEKDEKNLPITDDNWGVLLTNNTQHDSQPKNMTRWDSDPPDKIRRRNHYRREKRRVQIVKRTGVRNIRWDLRNEKGWKGHIRLNVCPIKFDDPIRSSGLCAHGQRPVQRLTDICEYIGDIYYSDEYGGDPERRTYRLYFDELQFPPPPRESLRIPDNCPVFEELRNYIRHAALRDHSPVVCNGGKSNLKMFTCNKRYRNEAGQMKKCPFCFQLRWDVHGYYIHLLSETAQYNLHNCGQAWHCCRP